VALSSYLHRTVLIHRVWVELAGRAAIVAKKPHRTGANFAPVPIGFDSRKFQKRSRTIQGDRRKVRFRPRNNPCNDVIPAQSIGVTLGDRRLGTMVGKRPRFASARPEQTGTVRLQRSASAAKDFSITLKNLAHFLRPSLAPLTLTLTPALTLTLC
jgi:hypothetical protein